MRTLSVTTLALLLCVAALGRAARLLRQETKTALVVVDVQPCFMPGGSLPVVEGDLVVPLINTLLTNITWDFVAFTQDYHPAHHVSFASTHGMDPFTPVELTYTSDGKLCNFTADVFMNMTDMVDEMCDADEAEYTVTQMLWPDHCIQGTEEGELDPDLLFDPSSAALIQKGDQHQIDGYSGMYDIGRFQETDLPGLLKEKGITDVAVVGLAFDYCVYWTAKDLAIDGYQVMVIKDATRGIANETMAAAEEDMLSKGVEMVYSADLLEA